MNILPKLSQIYMVCGLVLVAILLTLLVPFPVRADVGAQPILPDGSSIKPEGETPIQMTAEKVVLTVRNASEADNAVINLNPEAYALNFYPVWYPAVAEVQADFTMKNPTDEVVSMTVWFPLASALVEIYSEDEIVPRLADFQVMIDGKAVETSVSELPNPQGGDKPLLPWASFPVAFPAGEEVPIQVSYILPAQLPMNEYLGLGMIFNYIFQTGAGWAGPIGQADLVVNLPYPASAETIASMPKGGQTEGQQARWTWENLEPGPQDDFSILLLTPERWEELLGDRAAVKSSPGDGQAWLKLCGTYHTLSFGVGGHIFAGFTKTYQPLAVQACQEAARLLPGDAAPHFELAMLYLPMLPQNPSPQALQPVLDELNLGQELEALQPPSEIFYNAWNRLGEYSSMSDYITANLEGIFNAATATADAATRLAGDATSTAQAEAALMQTPSATSTQKPTLIPSPTATPEPSKTSQPQPTEMATAAATGSGQSLLIIVAAGLIGLIIVGYFVLKRMRVDSSK